MEVLGHFQVEAVKSNGDFSTLVHSPHLSSRSCHITLRSCHGGGSLYSYMKQSPSPPHRGLREEQDMTGHIMPLRSGVYLLQLSFLPILTTLSLFKDLETSKVTSFCLFFESKWYQHPGAILSWSENMFPGERSARN